VLGSTEPYLFIHTMTSRKSPRYFFVGTLARQRGMTLIELMVAMLIGLLLSLAMVSTLIFGESQRRTTSATSDMDQSGAYAASLLDTALRNAGSGLMQTLTPNNLGVIGCDPGFTGALPAPFDHLLNGDPGQLRVAPVLIAANPSGATPPSDVLAVMSGSGAAGGVPRDVIGATGNTLTLTNTVGIIANPDTIPGDQPRVLINQPGSNHCAIRTVTAANANTLTLDALPAVDPTLVLPLGNQSAEDAQFQLFGVDPATTTLFRYDLLSHALQPLTGNVLAMQALYGIADSNGRLAQWVAPTGDYGIEALLTDPPPPQLNQIVAIRVALILKSGLREKAPASAAAAPTTAAAPIWFKPAPGTKADLAGIPFADGAASQTWTLAGNDFQYRYRVVELVIPVRNSLLAN
jgi:type IV pilus assembly protein PilW